jgi:hypothetical protein
VFLHDWDHLATTKINERAMTIPVLEGTEVAGARGDGDDRYVRIPWTGWLED